jgi:uncharacterized protein involved in exopolysaccharide biosynthesis
MNGPDPLSLSQVLDAVSRQKRKVILAFLLVLSLAASGVVFWPRTFGSEAKLFVRRGRESVTLDPTATMGETVQVQETRKDEINAIMEVLESRALAGKVVDRLGPATVLDEAEQTGGPAKASLSLKDRLAGFKAPLSGTLDVLEERLHGVKPISDREAAVTTLAKGLRIDAPRSASIIEIRYETSRPELAQQVLQAYVDEYLVEHVRMNRTAGSRAFFQEQFDLLGRELEESEAELRDAKNALGVTSIAGQRAILQAQLDTVEQQLLAVEASLGSGRAKTGDLSGSLEALPERMMTESVSGAGHAGADGMRQQLYELELREREALSKFTPAHPRVAALQTQLRDAREIFQSQAQDRSLSTTGVNPVRQELQVSLLTEQADVASLAARRQALEGQHRVVLERVRALNEAEVRVARLERRVELASANYAQYADKLEQARIDEALEKERISNVNVVQPASFIGEPIGPNKKAMAAMGLLAAVFASLLVGVGAERLNRSLRSPAEVEKALDLPVLMSLPRTSRNRLVMN